MERPLVSPGIFPQEKTVSRKEQIVHSGLAAMENWQKVVPLPSVQSNLHSQKWEILTI